MSQVVSKYIDKDANSLEDNGTELRVKVDDDSIERTASGLAIKANGVGSNEIEANAVTATELDETATYDFTGTLQYGGINVATETFVNNAVQGLDSKHSVLVATTANITLSGEQTIDGVLTSANRVLVKDQTDASENGIYVSAAGAWARATDTDTWDELRSAYTWVEKGTANADTGWTCIVDDGGTLETTDVDWTQFTGAALITAGAGMTKSGNTLNVIAADASLTINANDMAVNVDGSTITVGGGGIQVPSQGITETQLHSSVAGDGLTGGNGTALSVVASALIKDGAVEIDGDKLDIDWNPSNYTPTSSPAEATDVDHLTAHLAGIDAALVGKQRTVETITLDGTDISNEYVTLGAAPATPGATVLHPKGGPTQFYGDDFEMDGTFTTRLKWNSLGFSPANGDKITVIYDV